MVLLEEVHNLFPMTRYRECDVVNIASYHLKPGDKVAVREKSKSLDAIERSLSNSSHVYEWITWNNDVKRLSFLYQLDFKFQKTLKNS
jgi:ribosomal protein S4